MKFWNWTKNQKGDRVLKILGIIDYSEGTTPEEFRGELQASEGNIFVEINSPGGSVFAAAEIYEMLKGYSGGKVTARIVAFAASAATIIAMAADTVEISTLAVMCIHNPFLDYVQGEKKDLLKAVIYLDEIKENIITAYEQKTTLSRQEISKLMDDETYMNSKKAVELHFADKIIDGEEKELTAEMYSRQQEVKTLLKKFNITTSLMEHANKKFNTEILHRKILLGGM